MQSASEPAVRTATHHNVRALLWRPGFRRLLGTRLLSQVGDGWFQAGLAGSVFFNPERGATPLEITAGFAVLLLPYSALGPFVGVFLDRWSRRSSLAVSNVARAVFVVPAAICVWLAQYSPFFVLAALAVIALNRFFLTGNAAAIPHVVDAPRLVTANSFASTAGTVCYTVSLGAAAFAINLLGTGQHHYALVSLVGTACYLVSALLLLTWFPPGALGPDDAQRPANSVLSGVRDTVVGMVAGLRHIAHRPKAGAVLLAQAGHRFFFGLLTLGTLLLYRNHYSHGDAEASLTGLIPVAAAGAAGALLAALLTPPLVRRMGPVRWMVALTAPLAALVPALGVEFRPVFTVAGALVVSFAAQGAKIITDTTLQIEADDDYRGRVFSVNDTGFNIAFVLGLFVASLVLPADGVSIPVMVATGAGYLLLALAYGCASRRIAAGQPRPRSRAHASSSASASSGLSGPRSSRSSLR
jgi:MFS family permease